MKRNSVFLFFLGLLVILFWGCQRNEKAEIQLTEVSIGIQNSTTSGLVFIAQEKGFFKENGLNVDLKLYPSGKLALKGMLTGEADLATVADIPITVGAIAKENFKIISTISETDQGAWIIARKDKGINSVQDLKGKTIGTQGQSAVHFFLHLFLIKNDLHDDFTLKLMPAVELVNALASGEIDAFSMRNPFIAQAKEKLADNAIEFFEPGLYIQSYNLVARNDYIELHEDVLSKTIRSLIQAEEYIHADEQGARLALIARMGQDRKDEVLEDWPKYDFHVSLKQYLIILLEDETLFAGHQGLVEEGNIPNFLNYIYTKPLTEVDPTRMTIIK